MQIIFKAYSIIVFLKERKDPVKFIRIKRMRFDPCSVIRYKEH